MVEVEELVEVMPDSVLIPPNPRYLVDLAVRYLHPHKVPNPPLPETFGVRSTVKIKMRVITGASIIKDWHIS